MDIAEFKLTSTVNVGVLRDWMNLKDENSKRRIIELIYHRFHERYLVHLGSINSGFLKMAVSCLMIETIQSFKQGVIDSSDCGRRLFKDFFESEKEYFPGFTGISFYADIRCGILHQAETTNAWRILLRGRLLDRHERAINAGLFVKALSKSLDKYISDLNSKNWDDQLWANALIKLEDICNNCNVKP